MKRALTIALASILATTAANATEIDFEASGGGTTISESGVTITAGGQNIVVATTPNGTNGILSDGSPRSEFTATFDFLTNFVSVDLGDFNADSDTLFLEAFGLGDVLLGSDTLLIDGSDSVMHTLSFSGAGISYVLFGGRAPSVNGSSVFADNLIFNSAAVPEAGTWAMMLIGFGGIGYSIRRRRSSPKALAAA